MRCGYANILSSFEKKYVLGSHDFYPVIFNGWILVLHAAIWVNRLFL